MRTLDTHLETVRRLCRQYRARRAYLFGSALERPGAARDLDFGVEGIPSRQFFSFMGELIAQLPMPVDLADLDQDTPFTQLVRKYGRVIYDTAA